MMQRKTTKHNLRTQPLHSWPVCTSHTSASSNLDLLPSCVPIKTIFKCMLPFSDVNLLLHQVRGKPLVAAPKAELYYFAVHKPPGYICSNICRNENKRAVDLLKPWLEEWEAKKKAKVRQAFR